MGETWRVSMRPLAGEQLLIVHLIQCDQVFRALTKPQRAVLLAADDGRCTGHPRPLAALVAHGLADENHVLTEAGREVRFWNLPPVHPDRVAHAEQMRRSTK